jgi:MFS transporter, DHA2 family, multidrug resistance protein
MLDLGHEHDWFHSNIINSLAAVAIAGFIVFLIWEITEHNPIVNVRVFRHRGFTISVLALSFGFGAFFGSIVLIPQWLQINIGYTATWAGYVTATMGFGSLTMSPVVAKLSTRYDQRALACFGLLVLGGVTFMRALWTSEADFMALAIPQILQGFAVPFFFIPLSNIALASVLPQEIASAAGLMSFMRTMAGAIGASMSATMWDDHAKLARSEIVSSLNPEPTQHTLVQSGMSPEGALAMISNLVNKEALTLAADHVFLLFSLVFVVSGLIIWLCPKPKTGAATGPTH